MKKICLIAFLLVLFPLFDASAFNPVLVCSGVPASTAPTFSSATINADAAVITLSEDVTVTGLANGDFVMTGSTTGAVDLNSCSEDAGVISCTAASEFVNGETVTLAYTGNAPDDIEDLSGNDLEDFSGESVTNNTPAAVTYEALYYFESGATTTDSSGNSNTLTEENTPSTDTSNYKQGSASIAYDDASVEYSHRTDANLSAGFPAKSSGGAASFTILWWMRPTGDTNVSYVINKYDLSDGRSFAVILDDTSGSQTTVARSLSVNHGYDGGGGAGTAFENVCQFGESMTLNNWYWVQYSYDSTERQHRFRIWDDTNSQWLGMVGEVTEVASADMSLVGSDLAIGCRSDGNSARAYDGNIDGLVFYSGIMSDAAAEAIRDGSY